MGKKKTSQKANQQVEAVNKPGGGVPHKRKRFSNGILIGIIVLVALALVFFVTPLREIVWSSETAPEITLELAHDTVIWSDDGRCIFEVEAKVKGNPQPVIHFSRNDRLGETLEYRTFVILEPGESFTLVATAVNSLGQASDTLQLYAPDSQAEVDYVNGEDAAEPPKTDSPPPSATGPAGLPDLVITTGSPTITPSTVAPGGTVTLSSWKVKNQGTAVAGSFQNGFYLSTTSNITAADIYLGHNSNSSLAPGEEYTWVARTLTIPAGTAPGTYYIGILVDRNNTVAESNENNNFVSRQITVSAPAANLPDLVITTGSPTVTPSTVAPGGTVSLSSWTVKNQGTADAGPSNTGIYLSTTSTITASDILLVSNSISGLSPGISAMFMGSLAVTIPAGTTPGTYYIGILADRNNTVAESDETNNFVSRQITVSAPVVGLPELRIKTGSLTVAPLTIAPGGTISLSMWTVENTGTADAGPFRNGIYLSTTSTITASDILLGETNNHNGLAAGGEHTWAGGGYTVPAGTTPGTYYIGVLVDRNNTVAEYNEDNNFVSRQITVAAPVALPDLIITAHPTVNPLTVTAGATINISSWTVKNQGTAAAGPFHNGIYFSTQAVVNPGSVLLNVYSHPGGLAAGAEYTWPGGTLTIPATALPGTYYIVIMADHNNQIVESNENNNSRYKSINVVGLPDLVIKPSPGVPILHPLMVKRGYPITLSSWTVQNQGTAAAGPFYNGYYLSTTATITSSDVKIGFNYNSVGLSAGLEHTWGSVTLIIPYSTVPGTYYFGILVDDFNHVTESNENNNFVSRMIEVLP